ncbi:MAG: hypothetical protein D8M59_05345 [Planctomycetes bacterium]|nr:hypothetical protein [Planctomycetota bacterium]NOG55997.1 hypothetical protein [Planctomycetota bacterium]
MRKINGIRAAGLAVAGCTAFAATGLAQIVPVTHATVLVEEWTAEWCGPCVGGYYSMERAHDRWGDAISELTYSIADRYENPDANKREGECGVYAIPTFLFGGTYMSVGTPSDGTIDTWIAACQGITPKGRIIGHWEPDEANGKVNVGIKIEADEALSSGYELRIAIWEDNWEVYCSNGLPGYHYHVQQVFYEDLPVMSVGDQYQIEARYDLSGNQWIHNWSELGVTVYLYDRNNGNRKNVGASWSIGEVNLGDLNGDLKVSKKDGQLFRDAFGSEWYQGKYNAAGDWDQDGRIDKYDYQLFKDYWYNGGMR